MASPFDQPNGPPAPPPIDGRQRVNQVVNQSAIAIRILRWIVMPIAVGVFVYHDPGIFLTLGIFILTLGILVFVHEWGHYQFARWAGMKVNRFGIGFPPWIFTVRRNNIDYSIGALPIGGMVDIAGLGSEEEMVGTVKGEEVAVRPARRDVAHGERQFQDAKLGWRFMTLFAGPLMNFLFALVVFISVFSIAGINIGKPTNRVDKVLAGSPAEAAGIKADDMILRVNDKPGADTQKLHDLIANSTTPTIKVEVLRQHVLKTFIVTPKTGAQILGEGTDNTRKIGIEFHLDPFYQKVGLTTAIETGIAISLDISSQIFHLLTRVVTLHMTKADKQSVGGPVKIAQAAGESAKEGWQGSAVFAAELSVNLGLLNLLPFPALDGGRILFLGFELIAGKPLDPKKEGLVHMVGMAMLLAFMLFITARDILPYIMHKAA